jgi:hypothetical protein
MTSHREFRRYFAKRHAPRMQFLRNRYDFGASLSIRFPAGFVGGKRAARLGVRRRAVGWASESRSGGSRVDYRRR